MQSWTHALDHAAERSADIVALQDDLGATLTYGELHRRVERAAGGWKQLGVRPGDRVAILDRNSAEYVVQLLAISRAGAIPTLLNWRLAEREILALANLFEPTAILHGASFESLAAASGIATSVTTDPTSPNSVQGLNGPSVPRPVDRLLSDSVCAIIHTSGTTGLPKGVPLTFGGVMVGLLGTSVLMPETPTGTPHLRIMPLFHLSGLAASILALLRHDTLLLHQQFDPDDFLDTIERERVVFSNAGPSLLRRICDAQQARPRDLSSLQELWYGTEPMPPPVLERAIDLIGCRFRQNYGMTEAQRPVTQLEPDDHRLDSPYLNTAGRVMSGFELRIVDEQGNNMPDGEPGEVWIRSDSMFPGYWQSPEATAAAFTGPTDRAGLSWYRTGDVGSMTDGYLTIRDRLNDMIVTGGENVYAAEVENALRRHPDVGDVAVIGRTSEKWGESVHAVVVPTSEGFDDQALIEWCRDRLAHFKCPKSVSVVEALPRNATGKTLRRELREQFSS